MINFLSLLDAFWWAFGISAVAAYPIYRLLVAMKSHQTVSEYAPKGHQVKQGTPTMGGIIIAAGFIGAALILKVSPEYIALFTAFAFIGFVDDLVVPKLMNKRGLGWKQKIILQALACYGTVVVLHFSWFSIAAVLIILFMANAFNFLDGLDGLAASSGTLLFLGLIGIVAAGPGNREYNFISVRLYHQAPGNDLIIPFLLESASLSPIVAMICVGALIPFAYLNAPKAKLFMGDVGSLPLGAIYGLIIVKFLQWDLMLALPLLILSIPMICELVPVPLQIFSVKVFKRKLFPFTPIHHAFEKAGWPETRVTAMFAIIQFLCVVLSVTLVFGMVR